VNDRVADGISRRLEANEGAYATPVDARSCEIVNLAGKCYGNLPYSQLLAKEPDIYSRISTTPLEEILVVRASKISPDFPRQLADIGTPVLSKIQETRHVAINHLRRGTIGELRREHNTTESWVREKSDCISESAGIYHTCPNSFLSSTLLGNEYRSATPFPNCNDW